MRFKYSPEFGFDACSARWLRVVDDNAPVEIAGAYELEYRPTLDDVHATLTFLYTPVTQEGVKGQAHETVTAPVTAGTDLSGIT
jgi:hypothetical protein